MSLTGTPFFLLTIAVLVLATTLMVWSWNRIPGPSPVRYAARAGLTLLSQFAAVAVVLVWLNNSMGPFYESWGDLLGSETAVQLNTSTGTGTGTGPADGRASHHRLDFHTYTAGVYRTVAVGERSGIKGSLYIWLPPQYHDPAYAQVRFPVVELLPGTPGTPQAWFGTMRVQRELAGLVEHGQAKPMILVSAKLNVLGGNTDAGCADLPNGVRTATWLAKDVPALVRQSFRASDDPRHWAVMGYSAGGYCAVNLTVQHPESFRSAVSLSGYNAPESPLVLRDPQLARRNNPYLVLRDARSQPPIALLLAGSLQDHGTVPDARQLLGVLRDRSSSEVLTVAHGGHSPDVWRAMLPTSLTWISTRVSG